VIVVAAQAEPVEPVLLEVQVEAKVEAICTLQVRREAQRTSKAATQTFNPITGDASMEA